MVNPIVNSSIRVKISLVIVCTIAVLGIIAGFLINNINRKSTKEANAIIIEACFNDVHQAISMFIQERWADIDTLNMNDALNSNSLQEFVANSKTFKGDKIYEEITLIDHNARVVSSSKPELLGQTLDENLISATSMGTHFEINQEGDEIIDTFAKIKGAYIVVAKISNERISELAQSARPYPASSDNYLFTLTESKIGPAGTAISRSAFEKDLLAGIPISKGMVQVQKNTEIELRFHDPETNELTKGVSAIVKEGKVSDMQGYPDYRHVPVVGVGGTIKYADDFTAGLISEADLNVPGIGIHGKDEDILKFLVILGLVLILACATAIWIVATKIKNRISAIMSFVDNSNDLNFRLEKQSADELGKLTEAINEFLAARQVSTEKIHGFAIEAKKMADQGVVYKQILDGLPINILLADLNANFTFANTTSITTINTYQNIAGINGEQLLGKSFDIFHQDTSEIKKNRLRSKKFALQNTYKLWSRKNLSTSNRSLRF
jgi:HAMP domain-containing protein